MLLIRDGWGANPDPGWNHANAVFLARTPYNDELMTLYPHCLIHTSGEEVGLPAGVMGNSEVGHQNIGAGRIVDQEVMRITRRIREGEFFENQVLIGAVEHAKRTGGVLHLMGLCSDGGVHSVLDHAYATVELAKRRGLPAERLALHAFGDGRDTAPNAGVNYIQQVERKLAELGIGRVASVVGRYYAMDRDNRWDRVERAYRMLTAGEGCRARTAAEAFRYYYGHPSENSRQGDEFVEPTVIVDDGDRPVALIRDGDAVIFFNFRGDRPRELTKAFTYERFPYELESRDGRPAKMGFQRPKKLDLYYATMTEYERGLPVRVAFPKPPKLENIFGAYISGLGLRQFRCAETEKYPHVTFFFNDYRDEPFPGEVRMLIPSPREISTYDQKPEMSAFQVADEVLRQVESDAHDSIVVNFANGDMVGHTGSLPAAIKAVETVDACVGRLVRAVQRRSGSVIVTADHGNCEQMIDPATGGPHTAHTTFDVDLILVDDRYTGNKLRPGRLADVAPTLLDLMGLDVPREMTGSSLIQK
jgi:2,3-bisphosphoglycerate-independent phosphoglycerate mutase